MRHLYSPTWLFREIVGKMKDRSKMKEYTHNIYGVGYKHMPREVCTVTCKQNGSQGTLPVHLIFKYEKSIYLDLFGGEICN